MTDDSVFAALLEACKQAGYDTNHEKRKKLEKILTAVQAGGDFPREILENVMEKTNLSKAKLEDFLQLYRDTPPSAKRRRDAGSYGGMLVG